MGHDDKVFKRKGVLLFTAHSPEADQKMEMEGQAKLGSIGAGSVGATIAEAHDLRGFGSGFRAALGHVTVV